jgi:hypothetical protein
LNAVEVSVVPDLDVVPRPTWGNYERVARALRELGAPERLVPTRRSLVVCDVISVPTAFGPVDVLAARGREEFHALRQRGARLRVLDVTVLAATVEDTMRLRARFKEPLGVG